MKGKVRTYIVRTGPGLPLTLELQDDRQHPEPHNQSLEPEHSRLLRERHTLERHTLERQRIQA